MCSIGQNFLEKSPILHISLPHDTIGNFNFGPVLIKGPRRICTVRQLSQCNECILDFYLLFRFHLLQYGIQ